MGNRGKEKHAGFTILELLVVMAIMVILTAIVVPSLFYARRVAQKAETTHLLNTLQNACESYYQAFNDYPGPVAETSLGNSSATQLNGAQNLFLGLVGRIADSSLPNAENFGGNAVSLGGTVTAHSAGDTQAGVKDLANGQSYPMFYKAKSVEYGMVSGGSGTNAPLKVFYDHYGDPLPILYFGSYPTSDAPGATPTNQPVVLNSNPTPAASPTRYYRVYLRGDNSSFFESTGLQSLTGRTFSQVTSGYTVANDVTAGTRVKPAQVTVSYKTSNSYPIDLYDSNLEKTLTNDSTLVLADNTSISNPGQTVLTNTARNSKRAQGSYVLMSAGEDRIYGPVMSGGKKIRDADDIVVFSP